MGEVCLPDVVSAPSNDRLDFRHGPANARAGEPVQECGHVCGFSGLEPSQEESPVGRADCARPPFVHRLADATLRPEPRADDSTPDR
jgi:hypothetical protein